MQKLPKIPDHVGIGFTLATVPARKPIPIVKELKKVFVKKRQKSSQNRALYPRPEQRGLTAHRIRFPAWVFLVILFLHLEPLCTAAADMPTLSDYSGEYAFLTGYGITHRGFGDTRTQVETFDIILRYGRFLSAEVGKGHWFQGRHELFLELPFHLAVDHDDRTMEGGYILGSWKFTAPERLVPYVFAGGGILYVDLGLPTMGSRLDFSYQGGTGIQYFIRKDLALMAEYRYHHISNAGTAMPNEPLNSSKFLVGVSLFH